MPPKKKAVKNAYFFFMEKYREDRNRKYPNDQITIKDAASLCSPLWQKMTPDEKKVYEDIAKKEKLRMKGTEIKWTTTGLAVSEVERKEREHQEFCARMKADIKDMLDAPSLSVLQSLKFYFIHVNHFCQCDNGDYIPAEVGLSCFSLENGIEDYIHFIVNPGNLPIGYTFKAQKHSEDTHGIPIPPSEVGESDYYKLFVDIFRFLTKEGDGKKVPPLFTLNEFEPCASNFLEKLCFAAAREGKVFQIYDLIQLFFEMRNKVALYAGGEGFPVYCLAESEIENDAYAYTKEICCYWHEGTEGPQHCSLSRVRRWGFHLANHCCRDLDIKLIPGQHLPISDKYWNTEPPMVFQSRPVRKKAPSTTQATNLSEGMSSLSLTKQTSKFQPLRQPHSMGIAVAQAVAREENPLALDEKEFPQLGKRIGANFNRLT